MGKEENKIKMGDLNPIQTHTHTHIYVTIMLLIITLIINKHSN